MKTNRERSSLTPSDVEILILSGDREALKAYCIETARRIPGVEIEIDGEPCSKPLPALAITDPEQARIIREIAGESAPEYFIYWLMDYAIRHASEIFQPLENN